MLTEYIDAAMHQAVYEILQDDCLQYGEIPGLLGVWATAATLEQCHKQLQEVLEDWLLLSIRLGHDIPSINGISLATARVSKCHSSFHVQTAVNATCTSSGTAERFRRSRNAGR